MDKELKPQQIRELTQFKGWHWIDSWFESKETEIVNAIKDNLIKLNWAEKDKWFAYYSGEATIIRAFREFIQTELKREQQQQKVKDWSSKFWHKP